MIQFGLPRTATTLQFQILCVLLSLSYEHEINNVGCYFDTNSSKKYYVIKYHHLSHFPEEIPRDLLVFMTESKSFTIKERKKFEKHKDWLQAKRIKIPLIVDIETVKQRSYNVVYDYQHLFNVSDIQMKHAVQYLRYWDILRLCCGQQMSRQWRMHLQANEIATHKQIEHSSTVQFCLKYNVSEIEQEMIKTYVYQHFSKIPSLFNIIGRPSNADGVLDGTYCARCSKNIIENKKIKFNQKCI